MNAFRHFKILLAVALLWILTSAVSVYAVGMTKGFSPNPINPGDTSMMTIIVFNDTNAALTNVGWTDNMPVDMTIQSSPLPTNNCGGTLVAVAGTSTVTLSGGTVAAQIAGVAGTCTVVVPVKTSVAPGYGSTNTILAGSLTTVPSYTNAVLSTTLTTNLFASPTLSTSLDRSLIYLGEQAKLTVSITNTDPTKTLTLAGWANTLPTGLEVNGAATNNGLCGTPTVTAVLATTAIALSNATVLPSTTCSVTIPITGNAQGNYTMSFPAGVITSYQNATNASPSSQAIAVQSFSASKTFTPATVKTNQVSVMSITISSKAAYANLAFTDNFASQTGLVIAPVPNAVITGTGCTGTVTANPGSQVVSLSAGSIPAGTFLVPSTCTISVNVVVPSNLNIGTKTNTMAIGSITSGTASNINVASATLTVNGYTAPTLTQSLSATTSFVGQVVNLLVNVKNNDATTFTNVGWIDTLPTGLVVAGAATFSAGCGTPVVNAPVGGAGITFSGASIATGATCTATIPVTATQQGAITVTAMPIGIVTNDQGTSNIVATSAPALTASTFTVVQKLNGATPTATMSLNTATKLRIEITNKSTDTYHNLSFSDSFIAGGSTLPATFTVINPANAVTTCNAAGTPSTVGVTTTASTVALSGGILAAGNATNVTPTCYVEVDVQATAAITSKLNVIPGGVTALADGTGILTSGLNTAASATVANLTISAAALVAPTISTKTFTPASIVVGSGLSTLKISVKNNDLSTTLTNVTWTDTFPAGMVWTGGAINYLNCGTGTVTFDVTNSIATLGGGVSLAPGAICDASIPVKATQQGALVNNIPVGAIGNDQLKSNTVAKAATLTSTSLTAVKAFTNTAGTTVTDMNVGDTFKLKITITNPSLTESYNALSFTDSFANYVATVGGTPALQIAAVPNASTTCVGGSVTTGAQSVSLTGGTLAANSSCVVIVDVTALAVMAVTTNTIVAGTLAGVAGEIKAVSVTNGSKAWKAATTTANLTISTIAPPTFTAKTFAPTSVFMGQSSTLTISVKNNDATATLNNVSWTDTFPSGLVVAGTPAATKNAACGAATFAPLAGATSLVFSGGVILPGATCTVTVNVTGTTLAGSYTNSIGIGAITTTEGVSNVVASPAPALWLAGVTMTKTFSVSPVAIGGTTRLTINVNNNTTVTHPNIALTDDFSAQTGLVIANPPNVVSSGTGCTPGTVTAVAGTGVVSLSGFALAAGTQAVAKTCTVQVDVVGNISGAKTNTIYGDNVLHPGLGLVALPSQFTTDATAPLTVNPATLTVAKTFTTNPVTAPVSIRANGTDVALMRITITNPNLLSVNSVGFSDTFTTMPGLVISNAAAPVNTCGGVLTATVGSNAVSFAGAVTDTLATGASCYIEVPVVSTAAFIAQTNSVAVTAKTSMGESIAAVTATANLTANPLSVSHAFGAASLIVGGNTSWTITIVNNSATTQTAVAFSDTFTSVAANALFVDTVPTVVNTCGGAVTAAAGTNVVSLANGTILANSSCSISVNMVGNALGTITNNVVSVTSSQQTTAVNSNNASLTVINPSVLINAVNKVFTPPTVTLLQNSTASITWSSTSVGNTVNPIVTDNLPVGLTVAAVPNVTASCITPVATPAIASTTVSPTRNQIVVALTITQLQNQVCTITFDVTPTQPGTLTNALAKGDILSADGTTAANTVTASANLIVTNVLTIGKSFQPTDLSASGVSMLTITLTNPESIPLTGAALTDTLPNAIPNNLVVALGGSNPLPTTDCTVDGLQSTALVATTTATAIKLVGGVIPSKQGAVNGICHITVPVKLGSATPTTSMVNTIAIGALTTTEGRTNINAATATINFVAPTLGIAKSFTPTSVSGGSVSQLTVTITNNNNFIQTGLAFADIMPAGMTVGLPANPQTTCTGGTFTNATTGSASWSFSGGVVPASGTCTVSLNVTMNVRTTLTNTIPLLALTSANGGTNNIQQGVANLTNLAGLSIAKAFSPNPAVVNQPIRLTFTITNSSDTTSLTGLGFTDDLTLGGTQTGLTVSPTPNVSNTCGGALTANGTSIALSGGLLAPQAVCVIAVDVVSNTVGSYTNTVAKLKLISDQGLTNANPGTDTLPVYAGIRAIKQLSPTSDAGRFVLTLSPAAPVGVSTRTNVGHDATPSAVASFFANEGVTYTVTESGQGATSLANYLTTWACRNADNTLLSSGSTTVATVTPPTTLSGATKNQQDITCTFTNVTRQALVSVNTVSNGGIGSFTFTGNNGLPVAATTIATTTAGVSATTAALTNVVLTAKNVATVITDGALPAGFVLTGASCTGLQGADTVTLAGGQLTIPATSIVDGARIACTFTHAKLPTVTVTKVSNGGTGTFTFTGTNGWVSQNIVTAATGVGVAGATQLLTAAGVSTDIIEAIPPAGFSLTGIVCTGLGAGGTATNDLVNRKVTLDALATAAGSAIACTFTNTFASTKTLTLRKQWVGANLNDAVNITATGTPALSPLFTPLFSIANIASKIDTGTTQTVLNGAVITIAETFAVGSAANYTATLACTGTTGLVGNVLTVGAADTAIVCTQTNTFSGVGTSRITGTVFKDNGVGGANNGIQEGGELGIAGVTITAATGATVLATAITDGAGNYTLVLPSGTTGAITVTETNLSGMLSTGGSAGTSGGTYTRSTDVTAFTVVSGVSYSGLNFGDVPDNQFLTDGLQTALPGATLFYPHTFVAGTTGAVGFSVSRLSMPAITGWNELIYEDLNCNGMIDAGEPVVAASVAVVAGQSVCLLVKEFVPANVPFNAQNALTVTANFSSTFANPTGAVNFSYVRHDTTTVGQPTAAGLTLVKSVNTAIALPGANIIYTIAYTNNSSGPLSNVVINDATPAYTTFVSANCGALPLDFTSCSIAAPAVGSTGSIIYTFVNTLAPTKSGAVTFTVQVLP